MSISIRVDVKGLLHNLSALEQKQLPFAIAKAVTTTGLDFQKAERRHFADVFTLRRPDFIEKQGVKVMGGIATKAKPSITLGIDQKAAFLAKFETGATKLPTRSQSLSIPVHARRNKRDLITPSNRPRALLDRLGDKRGAGGVFRLTQARGKLTPGIYQRVGRGGRSVRELFASEPSAGTPRILNFVDTFKRTVESNFSKNFSTAFADAIRTAK